VKRIHATLLIIYIAACFIGLVIAEAWKVGRREWRNKHGLRRM
jgi:hypothetical protein